MSDLSRIRKLSIFGGDSFTFAEAMEEKLKITISEILQPSFGELLKFVRLQKYSAVESVGCLRK